MRRLALACLTVCVPTAASAACPDAPDWSIAPFLQAGDQQIDYWWLVETLGHARIDYAGGTEEYLPGGAYRFTAEGFSWEAPATRFYRNGARCIDYPDGPRIDYYLLANGRLVLVDRQGTRYIGLISQ